MRDKSKITYFIYGEAMVDRNTTMKSMLIDWDADTELDLDDLLAEFLKGEKGVLKNPDVWMLKNVTKV